MELIGVRRAVGVDDGLCVLAYGVDVLTTLDRRRPTSTALQAPTKFELIVNNKTAKTMGLMISESFLNLADEVIE